MTLVRKPAFDAVLTIPGIPKDLWSDTGNILAFDNLLDAWGAEKDPIVVTAPAKPFDRIEFLARYVNKQAPAITDQDITLAAVRLSVTANHIRAIMKVESSGRSFDDQGRPVILFEPHIFHRQTQGKWSPKAYSYAKWGMMKYPKSADGRWAQMADAAALDEKAALESASWGLFQIMGFHWKTLDYTSVQQFAALMAESEANHLDAVVKFIKVNGIAGALSRCSRGNPDSCREFAKAYNGAGYEKNNYHRKLAEAL